MKSTKQYFRLKSAFLICSILFLSMAHVATAQDPDVTESPYFSVSGTDSAGVNFSLASTEVNATISGVIANVVVEQLYFNTGDSTVDASYVFPMSSQAAIYSMEMDVNDRTIVAVIKRKAEAQQIFEHADSSGLTASLLEQHRPNVFQMSVANINPGDSITVRMVYTELLVPTNGVYQFVFPNIVGPRFTMNGEPWVNQASQDSFSLSQTELNINLRINAGLPLTAECVSHPTIFNNLGSSAETALATHPGSDFIVNYALGKNQIQTGLLLYEGIDENFFLAMVQPPEPNVPFNSPQREYIFIMDVSGSMSGQPMDISRELITDLLFDLNSSDKFNIIFFAGGSNVLSPNSLPVTSANIALAVNMIENTPAGGGTNLLPAMQQALNMTGTPGYSRTFVILTDGYVTVEKQAFELIRENLNEANFFAFGIGNSVNRYIIEGIAYVGEGEPFVVTGQDDPAAVAATFKEYIERPVLTNIEALFSGIGVYDVEPLAIPDVFAERPVIIYGKYIKPAQGSITVQGDYAGGRVSDALNFADYTANAHQNIALKYLWARKRIKLMSDYGIASNETDTLSIEEEITLLGLKYSLVTEYTSFVAVDSNAVSSSGGSENPDEGGGGGGFVEVDDIRDPRTGKKAHIKVMGTVTDAASQLKLRIENLNVFKTEDLTIQITDINGHIVAIHRLDQKGAEDAVTVPLGLLPSGIYFVSLVSESRVLDTEKFVIRL